ncbi:PorV/PorQ family protein [Pedobacter sp. ASV1-7]|uniref:PorV/PorQ family protein n=1 Tax=Pedobacter sp. ASV1-7 TaxID=3145237 RepID=UPI0032E91AF4
MINRIFFIIRHFLFHVVFSFFITFKCLAQSSDPERAYKVALPFLLITPDARSAGMGETGVSTSSDVYSIYWNAAKYAFSEQSSGVGISITPWKRQLAEDMNVFYLSGFHRLNELQTIATSIKYFTLGRSIFIDNEGNNTNSYKPSDLSIDFAYIRKLSEVFSLSTTVKYVRSDITALDFVQGQGITGQAFGADIGLFYYKPISAGHQDGTLAIGANISNLGTNIKYGSVNLAMPTLVKLGGSYIGTHDGSLKYAFSVELNKLLVKNVSNMPNVSTGLEVILADKLALRTGYYNTKTILEEGKYFTTGIGLNYLNFSINFSYLFPTQSLNASANTIRYSLGYTINKRNNPIN